MVYRIHPELNKVCYYKKLTDIENKKALCFNLDEKDGADYKFSGFMAISVKAFKELLNKHLDDLEIGN